MHRAMTMETPEVNTLTETIGEYWGYIVAVFGALAAIIAFVRKYVIKQIRGISKWTAAAIALPTTLDDIRTQLQFENGMRLQDWIKRADENMSGIKRLIAYETTARRAIWQSLDMAIFEASADGKFLWVNDAFLEFTGRIIGQITGNNWRNCIVTPDREDSIEEFARCVRDGTDCRMKFRMNTSDDTETWVLFDAVCNKDDLGNVLGFVGKLRETRDPRVHATT